jgi:glycyl-tRNA synthetase beta subunit
MVVEMTSLQGIMGAHYARQQNHPEAVASAIEEQYNAVSKTGVGLALALSDRLDSLIGLFSVGLRPKGSNDPFALRRAAIQIIENLISNEVVFDLREALDAGRILLPSESPVEDVDQVLEFINNRLETYLSEEGIRTSVIRSVLAEQGSDPFSAYQAANTLNEIVLQDEWPQLLDAYSRCVRITRDQQTYELKPADFTIPAERRLYEDFRAAMEMVDDTVTGLVSALRILEPAISQFFDNVLVMDEDKAKRENRLALVQHITQLPQGIADLSYLEGF